jgi:hypothetical protein
MQRMARRMLDERARELANYSYTNYHLIPVQAR